MNYLNKKSSRASRQDKSYRWGYRPLIEVLEARLVFASDFGDVQLPYKTLLAEGGAEHVATGPKLGANRDTEANGMHSPGAKGDDITGSPDDEDGVTFGPIRAGQVGATVTVNVAGGVAKLDAWIDFNGDGAWGGPLEQIADARRMVVGNDAISFDVPSWAREGATYARFRLSTAGDLGVGGFAADGEVEDHMLTIQPAKPACGCFSGQKIISTSADFAWSVYAADVDGDGDTDVLSASYYDDKIAWYENDGNQNFTAQIISTAANGAQSVIAADVDGDGDTDVLSASKNDDKIAWYENDGAENFTTRIISVTADGASSVFAADMDGDGDIDVLSASTNNDRIVWYKNDGNENFTTHTISALANGAASVFAADVDGDGDTDVLSASQYDDKIAWYENDGSQNFTLRTITLAANGARSVLATDVDGDDDMDVVSASSIDDKVNWYENDGNQNFTAHTIFQPVNAASQVFAADLDGDGDTDVLSASFHDNRIAWYKNDGNENFTRRTISSAASGARSVFVADVDGDGDLDVLSASRNDDKIAWYEQRRQKAGLQGGIAPDRVITPLPIPPPPGPFGDTRPFGDATVRERSASSLPNGRGSEADRAY